MFYYLPKQLIVELCCSILFQAPANPIPEIKRLTSRCNCCSLLCCLFTSTEQGTLQTVTMRIVVMSLLCLFFLFCVLWWPLWFLFWGGDDKLTFSLSFFFSLYPWTSFFFSSECEHPQTKNSKSRDWEREWTKQAFVQSQPSIRNCIRGSQKRVRETAKRENPAKVWVGMGCPCSPSFSVLSVSLYSTLCPTRILPPSTAITQSYNHTTTTGHPLVSSRLLVSPHSFLEGSKEHNQNNQNPKIQLSTAWSTSLPS